MQKNRKYTIESLRERAVELGFSLIGVTQAVPSPTLDAYRRWITAGMHAGMGYLAREDRQIRREDLNYILPGARSIIMVGLDYHSLKIPDEILNDPTRGRIASYAWGVDYHSILGERLEILADWIQAEAKGAIENKVYVDTGAILERSHAQQAGMGFIGKNTMLIHPRRGSNFFLGEIITSLEFDEYDPAHRESMCGRCQRCLQACPTEAFPEPYVLDARRCISYHTIENKGWVDRSLRSSFGNWVFGCDVCQDVCPFQRFQVVSSEQTFYPVDFDHAAPKLEALLMLDEEMFRFQYQNSPIYRIRRKRLVRNACIAAGNSADSVFIPYLIQLLYDGESIVRGHAAWGLWAIMGDEASRQLTSLYDREDDETVRRELEALIG